MRLAVQLDRAKGRLLEVSWIYDSATPRNVEINRFIRTKAPFSRWRTLSIRVHGNSSSPGGFVGPDDVFQNLESLQVIQGQFCSLPLSILNHKPTPKLQTLNLETAYRLPYNFEQIYGPVLRRISHLVLSKYDEHDRGFSMPPNITHLQADTRSTHNFPYILHYAVFNCTFNSSMAIDLRNLTTLNVNRLTVQGQIILPNLRSVDLSIIYMHNEAKIDAPQLQSLRMVFNRRPDLHLILGLALRHQGFGLWPSKSLYVEVSLLKKSLFDLLSRCPTIEQALLTFKDPYNAEGALNYLGGIYSVPENLSIENSQEICIGLKELELKFEWPISQFELWKERASCLETIRRASGSSLLVSGWWKGEEFPIILA